MTGRAGEAPEPMAVNLDDVCAPGTRLAWSGAILLLLAFFAVLVWGGTTNAGYATPRDPGAMHQKEASPR